MAYLEIELTETMPFASEVIHAILADYEVAHPAILPPKYFAACEVLQGGQGAGTRIKVDMTVMGTRQSFDMQVTEPEPGRKIVETDTERDVVTTFTIRQTDTGCSLTIGTRQKRSRGLQGFMEKLFVPGLTRKIFREQMERIREYATQKD